MARKSNKQGDHEGTTGRQDASRPDDEQDDDDTADEAAAGRQDAKGGTTPGNFGAAPEVERDFDTDMAKQRDSSKAEDDAEAAVATRKPPAAPADGGPPRLNPANAEQVRAALAAERAREESAKAEANAADEVEPNPPTVPADDTRRTMPGDTPKPPPPPVDPARKAEGPGQPPQEDPNRTLSPAEVAANVAILTGGKGDLQPVHPSGAAAALVPASEPAKGVRTFQVVRGVVQGFVAARLGQPSRTITFDELNLTDASIDRLKSKGVLIETTEESQPAE